MPVRILVTAVVSLLLHLVLGWAWTLGAGLVGGALVDRRGWLVGAAGVALGWGALVAYSALVAPESVGALLDILGGLFGNIPRALVVVCTVFAGALLGGLGGILGTAARQVRT
jgi:hypothetical protein